jgi:AcrR family transcriptional regulator
VHPTAERLLHATEELLHEQGQARISLRDITDRAGANVAAVSYHFRSKDALVEEAFRRALDEVTERRRRQLGALAPDADLRDVARTWLAPALDPSSQDPREAQLWALIARGMREEAPGLRAAVGRVRAEVDDELFALLTRHLPHLSPEEVRVRHAATMAALSALTITSAAVPPDGDLLLDWVVAGLSGPGRTAR